MATATYRVWTYDVWGNPKDGFTVNDRFKQNTITFDSDSSDAHIIRLLKREGYINNKCRFSSFSFDGEPDYTLYLNYDTQAMGSYPLLELEKEDD